MVKKIENKNLVIFDSINEDGSIKYKSLEEYINELFNNKKEDNLGNLFFECVTKYIYIKDNHLIHFSNSISILESNKIQEGLLVKKENIEETTINELNNANKSYYKMSNDSFNEIINLLADFTKLSKDNAEKTIEKEFKDYVVRKRK